jgi:hypothetical protein
MAVAALYSFLLDRHQASDHEGVLLVNILKVCHFITTYHQSTLIIYPATRTVYHYG